MKSFAIVTLFYFGFGAYAAVNWLEISQRQLEGRVVQLIQHELGAGYRLHASHFSGWRIGHQDLRDTYAGKKARFTFTEWLSCFAHVPKGYAPRYWQLNCVNDRGQTLYSNSITQY